MTPDNFEERLSRRTPRTLPAEWRAEILSAAFAEQAEPAPSEQPRRSHWTVGDLQWPALAAVWVIIATIHFTTAKPEQNPHIAAASPEAWNRYWREERRLIAELIEPPIPQPAPPEPVILGPRSGSRATANRSNLPA